MVDESVQGFWSLGISADGCDRLSLLSISGTSAPRALLQVPLDPLPADFDEGFVHYRANVRMDSSAADGSYRVAVVRSLDACIPLAVRN